MVNHSFIVVSSLGFYISKIIEMNGRSRYFWYYRNIKFVEGAEMQLEEVAKALKELGHPTRLFIFKHLVKAGEQGLPVGELQKQLAIPASTLSHHIAALVGGAGEAEPREPHPALRLPICGTGRDHRLFSGGVLRQQPGASARSKARAAFLRAMAASSAVSCAARNKKTPIIRSAFCIVFLSYGH
ncbi:ArsR/SmtB family transcription factor [Aeromonas veronii]